MRKTLLLVFGIALSLTPLARADAVVTFNEIMYHPATNEPAMEWVEFRNLLAVDVDISGWVIRGAIHYDFPSNSIVRGGGFVLVAPSNSPLSAITGLTNIYGPFTGRLGNNGDHLELRNNSGRVMDELDYGVEDDWPVAPDGSGVSLAKIDPNTASGPGANWAASAQIGGTPGAENFLLPNQAPPDTQRVAIADAWKYQDSGTDLGTAWQAPAYDDTAWSSRAAYTNRPVLTLFNTGVGDNRVALAAGAADPHYILTAAAQGTVGTNATVELNHSAWLANDAASTWIGVVNNGANNVAEGNYYFRTAFSLAGFIPSTVQVNVVVAADNRVNDVLLNGTPTGISYVGFAAWSDTNSLRSGFVAGTNTLEFRTANDPSGANPAGFRTLVSGFGMVANTNQPMAAGRTTYYFRKALMFAGDPALTRLKLDALVSDGAIIYLNGVEVYRQNMPPGLVDASTLALTDYPEPTRTGFIPIPAASLVAGTNVLAVEVHQAAGGVEGALFGMDLFSTPVPPPLTQLAFNEHSTSTNGEFWVELMNFGTNSVSLEGFVLFRDGDTNSAYVFPPTPPLAPGESLTVSDATLGFFPTSGDKLYLYDPARTTVFDSVVVKKRARGRWPDGTGEWLNPAAPTPGAPNSFVFRDEIVINEIMYHHARLPSTNSLPPQESREQWIEIFNRSTNTVDLTGWEIDGGVQYQFPTNRTLAPGAYLVIAENITDLRTRYPSIDMVGDFRGRLSGKSNRLRLMDPAGNPADTVRYFDGGHWPKYADGGGSSLELRDPNADNSRAEAWAASDETGKSSWQTYSYRMVAGIPAGSGQPTTWNDFVFGLLDGGECLIDDLSVIESPTGTPVQFLANGNFENGLTGWRVLGTHGRSRVEVDPDSPGNHVLRLIASGPQEHMHNHIEATYTSGRAVVNGREYQISYRAKWLAGNNLLNTRLYFNRAPRTLALPRPGLNGTPGAQNSRYAANIGPTFSQLGHQRVVPQPGEAVSVSVRAQDPQGVASCAVWWSANGGAWLNAPMTSQGDGLFTGTIPGQPAGTIVQFYTRAVDGLGAAATCPATGPDSGALYKVADGQANLAFAHNVRIILTPANIDLLHGTAQGVNQTNVMSNDLLPCTVVYDERRAYYDCGVHLRGSQRGRYSDIRTGFHINFQPDDLFSGVHPVMLIDRSGAGDSTTYKQEEIVLKHMLNRAGGIPGTYSEICRVIAPRSAHTGPAQWWPRHEDLFIETAFANGGDGTMFEMELIYYPTSANAAGYKNPQPDGVVGTDFTDLGNDKEIYRYNFMIKNHRDADDYSQFIAFCKAMSLPNTSPALQAQAEQILDMDEWMRAYAFVSLCSVGDMYTYGNNHNWFMYLRPSDGKLLYFPWDMDFVFTRGSSGALVGDQNLGKLVNLTPNLRRLYGHMLDIINVSFNASYMTYWTDHYDNFAPGESYSRTLNNIRDRATYVRNTINGAGGNAAFVVNGPGSITTSSNLITLSGTAPVSVKTLKVNDLEYPVTWTSISAWTLRLTVNSPSNELKILAYDLQDRPLTNYSRTVTVNYTGTPLEPQGNVVISEIMYRSATNGAAYIELQNRAAACAFDLSGWRIEELDYEFPFGTILAPRSILVLAQDPVAFAVAYTGAPTVFGTFSTPLDPNGQTLSLVQPSANPAEVVVVDRVRYESGAPWPAAANGQGAALQMIDGSVDNARVSDWSDGLGWRFVSITGTVATNATNFLIFLQQTGDVYIDDILLVPGTQAGVGESLVRNGDFEGLEGPLTAPWGYTLGTSNIVTTNVTYVTNGSVITTNTIRLTNYVQYLAATNLTNSVISGERVHSGNASLHMVSTGVGTVARSIAQAIASPPTNLPYTLSFWYYTSSSNATLVARTLGGSGMSTNLSIRAVTFTPGTANSTTAPLPPYPLVWLNEVQPRNVNGPFDNTGDHDPWIELYNSGPDVIALEDFYLASSYTNLTEWRFPAGAVIEPGQFLLVWVDGEPGETTASDWHASFTLGDASGSVALVRLIDGQPQIMDYLNFAGVAPDQSYGDYPDAQPFERRVFDRATPGASNLVPPVTVFINEWMANNSPGPGGTPDPADGRYDDWIELFNPGPDPADLSGLFLTDNLANRTQWRIPDGTVIPAGGFLLVWADDEIQQNGTGTHGDLHASFKLERNGEAIGLFALVGTNSVQIDAVTFAPQFDNVSEGRYPDAAAPRQFMATPTPRAPNLPGNTVPSLPMIPDQMVGVGQAWNYPIAATDPDVPPQTLDFSLIGMPPLGAALDPLSGLLAWSPAPDQIGTNLITVQVADNGTPSLSALRSFNVVVIEALLLENVTRLPTGEVSFTVGVTIGKTYRTEYKDDLGAAEWTPLGPDQVAVTDQLTLTFTPDASPQRFYRVVQLD